MKSWKLTVFVCLLALGIQTPLSLQAQVGWVAKAARELVEALVHKGGQQAAKSIADIGGEVVVRDVLERAAEEGGEKLAQMLATRTLEHGAALLRVARQSPSRFVLAFDDLTPAMQKAAGQAITREPELMARLFSNVGKEALIGAARHPGVGTQVVEVLGREGAEALSKITTDEAIQLRRLAPHIAKVAEPERKTLMEMIGKAPGTIMNSLEKHPKVLLTGAGVVSFIAAKQELLGGAEIRVDENGKVVVVPKPGFVERIWRHIAETFKAPLSAIIWIAGLIVLAWGAIKLWAVVRLEKAKVRIKEAQMNREARREKGQSA